MHLLVDVHEHEFELTLRLISQKVGQRRLALNHTRVFCQIHKVVSCD